MVEMACSAATVAATVAVEVVVLAMVVASRGDPTQPQETREQEMAVGVKEERRVETVRGGALVGEVIRRAATEVAARGNQVAVRVAMGAGQAGNQALRPVVPRVAVRVAVKP